MHDIFRALLDKSRLYLKFNLLHILWKMHSKYQKQCMATNSLHMVLISYFSTLRWRQHLHTEHKVAIDNVSTSGKVKQTLSLSSTTLDTLGIEPRAFRMQSGCDTTTPCAQLTKSNSRILTMRQRIIPTHPNHFRPSVIPMLCTICEASSTCTTRSKWPIAPCCPYPSLALISLPPSNMQVRLPLHKAVIFQHVNEAEWRSG